jgi:hypothetical protein
MFKVGEMGFIQTMVMDLKEIAPRLAFAQNPNIRDPAAAVVKLRIRFLLPAKLLSNVILVPSKGL